ncbi:MAG: PHP domain-containing protein [Chloroflexi bacterium]|nr:PHP domain-containing protein [Chloroflexota bacterium]
MAKLRLDLHTHIWEASGFQPPNLDWARKVFQECKAKGIDGIAITEHRILGHSFAYKQIIEEHFPGQLLVFPGWEIEEHFNSSYFHTREVGEFLLPNGKVFRNYCHPGHPSRNIEIDSVQSIEIDNPLHNWHIDKERVRQVARDHGLILTRVSDAHNLEDIGKNFTEIDLDELCARGVERPEWGRDYRV